MPSSLRILILGSGGREHALSWKLAQSPIVDQIFLAPGNGGTPGEPKTTNIDISASDFDTLVRFALDNDVNLVVPGPEQPLIDGVENVFRKVGIPVFGPSKLAASMEGSKAFAKDFMNRHNIPTAKFRTFYSEDVDKAVEYVKTCGFRVVLKASGLAAGKGVLIPQNMEETIRGLDEIMRQNIFGEAGNEVVVEEYLEGQEVSVLSISDGYTIIPLPPAQDHKRVGENDTGLNTGGMGAYAPAPVATPEVMTRIMNEALIPTITGMRKDGFPFIGVLFTGFMLTSTGPKLLEYNVRFGDPETEALMMLLDHNTDLAAVLLAAVEHRLDAVAISSKPGFAVSVILASGGYPGSYAKGKQIQIGNVPEGVVVFHAGTTLKEGKLLTSGGRVIAVSAYGTTLQSALDSAYMATRQIQFDQMTYRKDIAHRALSVTSTSAGLTYASAGVSVDAGNLLVERIKPLVKSTKRSGTDGSIGGFGGAFDLKATGYRDPVLVSGTDGVGTKLKVAMKANIHDTVGIDLVAMSVNDLIVQGAEPLYFLDYFACSHLDVNVASTVIAGIAEGCRTAGCALIGGETAEMPGMYSGGEYDLAGFAVGAVERHLMLPRADIQIGDLLIGMPSSGLHSNGFSLARKIIDEKLNLDYDAPCPWDPSHTTGQALLIPTRIYVKELLPLLARGFVKGLSHITGGGFTENIPRVLPANLGCFVDVSKWQRPSVFNFLQKEGNVSATEMARTFNNGVGMIAIVSADNASQFIEDLQSHGLAGSVILGEVTSQPGVELRGLDSWQI